jgi:hypothetical protein
MKKSILIFVLVFILFTLFTQPVFLNLYKCLDCKNRKDEMNYPNCIITHCLVNNLCDIIETCLINNDSLGCIKLPFMMPTACINCLTH